LKIENEATKYDLRGPKLNSRMRKEAYKISNKFWIHMKGEKFRKEAWDTYLAC
jgi:hypothetical protein